MILDNMLPATAAVLHRRYVAQRRAWVDAVRASHPEMPIAAYPLRRSRKRRPIPGVLDAAAEDEG